MVVYFLILTELIRFSVKFCVVKFSSFKYGFDGLRNKEWQEPNLGDAQGIPKVKLKDNLKPKLGDASGRHPLFRLRLSVTLLETIFLFTT